MKTQELAESARLGAALLYGKRPSYAHLARVCEVTRVSAAKWCKGEMRPRREHKRKLGLLAGYYRHRVKLDREWKSAFRHMEE